MTREQEIEARLNAATPGPWKLKRSFDYVTIGPLPELKDNCEGNEDDYAFIAHAPTDIAYLLEKVKRMKQLVRTMAIGQLLEELDD